MQELENQAGLVRQTAKRVFSQMGTSLDYKVGTMIEIPRAALVADEVCLHYLYKNKQLKLQFNINSFKTPISEFVLI